MMKKNKKINRRMIFQVVTISFLALLLSFIILTVITIMLINIHGIEITTPNKPSGERPLNGFSPLLIAILISFFIGLILSIYLSNRFLKPISALKKATGEVAKGNFNIQIKHDDIPENEVGELIENFNMMTMELNKNEILKSDFISNVSHEFKTPLSVIQGYVALLQDDNLSESDRIKYSNIILEATKRLTTLVNDILKISKIDNQKVSIEQSEYSLDEQIRESLLSFESFWSRKSLELNIDLENITIKKDKNLLSNVWNNLISNAIKYSKPGGKIDIILKDLNDYIEFSITDYGCGISSEEIPYIFDKFYQVDKSHNTTGNGLGLTLVKKILDLSNGTIGVESIVNEKTTFTVKLFK